MALGFYSSKAGPSFPWSRSPFLIGILLWAYLAGSFPYRICFQVYPKRGEQVIHSLFGMIIKKPLPGIVSTSYRCRHVCRQLLGPSASAPSALHFSSVNDAVVPDTHATVGHDESMSDGPLSFRLFILLLICPYHSQFKMRHNHCNITKSQLQNQTNSSFY